MEDLDERAQRIQDRLREDGDDEAAELIDELYGLWHEAEERLAAKKKPPKDTPETNPGGWITLLDGRVVKKTSGHWGNRRKV